MTPGKSRINPVRRPSYALTTLPLRRQEVQTRIRLVAPFTLAWTGRRLTFQRRLVTLWAWLMLLPNCGPLPQISQTCAMTTPENIRTRCVNLNLTGFLVLGQLESRRLSIGPKDERQGPRVEARVFYGGCFSYSGRPGASEARGERDP